jgi:hypothetical protein
MFSVSLLLSCISDKFSIEHISTKCCSERGWAIAYILGKFKFPRFQILSSMPINITVFWYISPWNLVDSYHFSSLKMEATPSSQTSITICQATTRCITEDWNLRIHFWFLSIGFNPLISLHDTLIEYYRFLIDSSANKTMCVAFRPNT